ncbi:MAG: hypothetical protein RBT79_09960, partial [Chiayiivirga sp.]|nr:hypothetical protein [Chiayiivirga sp.]
MDEALERGRLRVAGFTNPEMEYQLLRQLGAIRYGGAALGECLGLAQQIEDGNPQSWVDAFAGAAARQQADAERRAARGHAISARDGLLVACNSWRAAEYYAAADDPRHAQYGLASRDCFLAAMRAGGHHCEEVTLSCGSLGLPAYYLLPAKAGTEPGKTLMIISGYD